MSQSHTISYFPSLQGSSMYRVEPPSLLDLLTLSCDKRKQLQQALFAFMSSDAASDPQRALLVFDDIQMSGRGEATYATLPIGIIVFYDQSHHLVCKLLWDQRKNMIDYRYSDTGMNKAFRECFPSIVSQAERSLDSDKQWMLTIIHDQASAYMLSRSPDVSFFSQMNNNPRLRHISYRKVVILPTNCGLFNGADMLTKLCRDVVTVCATLFPFYPPYMHRLLQRVPQSAVDQSISITLSAFYQYIPTRLPVEKQFLETTKNTRTNDGDASATCRSTREKGYPPAASQSTSLQNHKTNSDDGYVSVSGDTATAALAAAPRSADTTETRRWTRRQKAMEDSAVVALPSDGNASPTHKHNTRSRQSVMM